MVKLNLIVLISLTAANSAYAKSSFDCEFDRHYSAYMQEERTEKYEKGITKLSINRNTTSKSTLQLDGSIRATNSKKWQLVNSNNLGASYIGSSGDLLTIIYKPKDGAGTYQAVLQWVGLGYAFSSIGSCTGEP